jgi:hypothetical protein
MDHRLFELQLSETVEGALEISPYVFGQTLTLHGREFLNLVPSGPPCFIFIHPDLLRLLVKNAPAFVKGLGSILVDEAHRFRDRAADPFAMLKELLVKSNAFALLLTSTPIVDRAADMVSLMRLLGYPNGKGESVLAPAFRDLGVTKQEQILTADEAVLAEELGRKWAPYIFRVERVDPLKALHSFPVIEKQISALTRWKADDPLQQLAYPAYYTTYVHVTKGIWNSEWEKRFRIFIDLLSIKGIYPLDVFNTFADRSMQRKVYENWQDRYVEYIAAQLRTPAFESDVAQWTTKDVTSPAFWTGFRLALSVDRRLIPSSVIADLRTLVKSVLKAKERPLPNIFIKGRKGFDVLRSPEFPAVDTEMLHFLSKAQLENILETLGPTTTTTSPSLLVRRTVKVIEEKIPEEEKIVVFARSVAALELIRTALLFPESAVLFTPTTRVTRETDLQNFNHRLLLLPYSELPLPLPAFQHVILFEDPISVITRKQAVHSVRAIGRPSVVVRVWTANTELDFDAEYDDALALVTAVDKVHNNTAVAPFYAAYVKEYHDQLIEPPRKTVQTWLQQARKEWEKTQPKELLFEKRPVY